jgi:hypothetical protein
VLTENLWPKLFSEAPRCAPLRLALSKANGMPSLKCLKTKGDTISSPVGIARPEERFTSGVLPQANGHERYRPGFLGFSTQNYGSNPF